MHELLQSYFAKLYHSHHTQINQSLCAQSNEIYGELYYYSVLKLLKHITITSVDHFLDVGFGLGKLVFQLFLTTNAASITGIEINTQRYQIANGIKETLKQDLPELFNSKRTLTLIEGDFLQYDFNHITIIYICSTVFSLELLHALGKKINEMPNINTIISLRKIPNLDKFKLTKKIFLHGTWDKSACYIYSRISAL